MKKNWACKVKPQIINEVRSDDFWTGKISKNTLMDKTIGILNLEISATGVSIYALSTNEHALLSNIELRTMNEENNPGAGMEIIESKMELGKQRILEDNSSIRKINLVTMTEMITNKNDSGENEISMGKQDSQLLNNLESPMRSFLSFASEQSSRNEKINISPL